MKRLVLLFAALLVSGCGEKSPSEGSESASETQTASITLPLSDADIERILEEAVELDSLQERNDLYYQPNKSKPYGGWTKVTYDSGQLQSLSWRKDGKEDGRWTGWHENGQMEFLFNYKDGKLDGLAMDWHENGQKKGEGTFKDGKADGLRTNWHENGQKKREVTYKDGKVVTKKFWNSSGEEVVTLEEAEK